MSKPRCILCPSNEGLSPIRPSFYSGEEDIAWLCNTCQKDVVELVYMKSYQGAYLTEVLTASSGRFYVSIWYPCPELKRSSLSLVIEKMSPRSPTPSKSAPPTKPSRLPASPRTSQLSLF